MKQEDIEKNLKYLNYQVYGLAISAIGQACVIIYILLFR